MSVSSGSVVNDSSRAFGSFESVFSVEAAKRLHCACIESMPGRCITVTGPNHFFIGNPISSRYRDPSIAKHSGSKCLEQSSEVRVGPSQSFCWCFTALVHLDIECLREKANHDGYNTRFH